MVLETYEAVDIVFTKGLPPAASAVLNSDPTAVDFGCNLSDELFALLPQISAMPTEKDGLGVLMGGPERGVREMRVGHPVPHRVGGVRGLRGVFDCLRQGRRRGYHRLELRPRPHGLSHTPGPPECRGR